MVVDGGMVSLEVVSKAGPDTHCKVVDPGLILSRANLTFRRGGEIIRARNAMLPVLSSKVRSDATVECCPPRRGSSEPHSFLAQQKLTTTLSWYEP